MTILLKIIRTEPTTENHKAYAERWIYRQLIEDRELDCIEPGNTIIIKNNGITLTGLRVRIHRYAAKFGRIMVTGQEPDGGDFFVVRLQ